jgi:peptidoglycan/LPS O-acetylase OafA/YrhL
MDTIRSVAILLVVLAHSVNAYGAPKYLAGLQFGGTGVDLFFILSGWLLGGQLFKEASTGRVNVTRFWIRRWMRTLPAYYVVLITLSFQQYLKNPDFSIPLSYLTFTQNYVGTLSYFSISWSLCVEEQFYLIIAPIIAVLANTPRKHTTAALITLMALPFIFRSLNLYNGDQETHIRLDMCVAGVFLAHICHSYKNLWQLIAKQAKCLAFVGLVMYLFIFLSRYNPEWGIPRNPDKWYLIIAFSGWIILANSDSYWREKLYFPFSHYIATRSYSLYLLHVEALAIMKRYGSELTFPLFLIITLILGLLMAEILHQLIEKPFMDLREKITKKPYKKGLTYPEKN